MHEVIAAPPFRPKPAFAFESRELVAREFEKFRADLGAD
jgi:hypothetical protein